MATATPKRAAKRTRDAALPKAASATRKAKAKATPKKAVKPVAKAAAKAAPKGAAKAAAKAAPKAAAKALTPGKAPGVSKLARFAARKAIKALVRKAASSSADAVRSAADRTVLASRAALDTALARRLPIQVSIDVAVPLAVAWEQWLSFDSFTEGIHRIEDLERDGNLLIGTVAGPRSTEWEAEVVDERELQSFAWRSQSGSDVAGLVTFHELSDRLTRIELDLDVLPINPVQAASLTLHMAHRHAEAELRRFKAHVEFINPDVYEPELSQNGDAPETERED
jgi:uncharacterized membrane protein